MKDNMYFELDQIFFLLNSYGMAAAKRLNPPLAREAITEETKSLPLVLPESMILLYGWRNGCDVSQGDSLNSLNFHVGYYFMSLEEGLSDYQALTEDADSAWDPLWYPLFSSGAGDYYAIKCSTEDTEDGPVMDYLKGEPDVPVIYQGIVNMIDTLCSAYQRNIIIPDKEKGPSIDELKYNETAHRLNPDVDYWKT